MAIDQPNGPKTVKFATQVNDFIKFPPLDEKETFTFACHPDVPCFTTCCNNMNIPLSPYDVLQLRNVLNLDSKTFIKTYCKTDKTPNSEFPLLFLKMMDNGACPFLTEAGCTVYEGRSNACRIYPLGRLTILSDEVKIVERYINVKDDHCKGCVEGNKFTANEWIKNQKLEEYLQFSDLLLPIITQLKETGIEVTQQSIDLMMLAFYRLDDFKGFIEYMNLMDTMSVPDERREKIMTDEKERLRFAIEWMEQLLFNTSLTPTNIG